MDFNTAAIAVSCAFNILGPDAVDLQRPQIHHETAVIMDPAIIACSPGVFREKPFALQFAQNEVAIAKFIATGEDAENRIFRNFGRDFKNPRANFPFTWEILWQKGTGLYHEAITSPLFQGNRPVSIATASIKFTRNRYEQKERELKRLKKHFHLCPEDISAKERIPELEEELTERRFNVLRSTFALASLINEELKKN
jgi:hypothetical protein